MAGKHAPPGQSFVVASAFRRRDVYSCVLTGWCICAGLGSLWPGLKQSNSLCVFVTELSIVWGKNSPLALVSSPLDFGLQGTSAECGVSKLVWVH